MDKNIDLHDSFESFKVDFGVEMSKRPVVIPTGIDELDQLLGGGFPPSLIVFGAESSLGKSTFALQLAQKFSSDDVPVLYFSLEMEKFGIAEKALRRQLYIDSVDNGSKFESKDVDSILKMAHAGKLKDGKNYDKSFKKALSKCEKDFSNLHIAVRDKENPVYTIDMITDLSESFIAAKKTDGVQPVIFVDYLQIIMPSDERGKDEKKILDENIAALWRLANNNGVTVFVISSFNRAGYNDAVTMSSLKGSGNIEYTADVILGMQYSVFSGGESAKKIDMDKVMKARPRKLDLKVLKNRYGASGATANCPLDFYNEFSYFRQSRNNAKSDQKPVVIDPSEAKKMASKHKNKSSSDSTAKETPTKDNKSVKTDVLNKDNGDEWISEMFGSDNDQK